MRNSKLVSLLKCFKPEETRSFEKFVISPYFTAGRNVSGLYSILKKHYPDFSSDELDRENVHSKLFPSEEFSETKLKNLSSALTNLAEQFLVHNSIKSENISNSKLLAKQYFERNSDKLFLSVFKTLESELSVNPLTGVDVLDEKSELLRMKEKYYIRKNKFSESIPLRLRSAEYSAASFLINYIKRLKDTIILPLFYNAPFENCLLTAIKESFNFEELINKLSSQKYPLLWLIEIYYNIYKAILCHKDSVSETYYEVSKKLFYDNIQKFKQNEKFYIFDSLAVYCTLRDPEDQKFTRECFEVNKKMLEEKIYDSKSAVMAATVYGNITLWAIDVSEFDWLEMFIEKYSAKLKDENKENMTHFAKANLYFARGDFEKSLYHISRVKNDFLLYKIQVRNLKFKIYYELNLFEQAFSLVDSYRHFLNKNTEIHESFKHRAIDFINVYSRLLKAKASGTTFEIRSIREKINSLLGYELRPWLREKINEIAIET